MPRTRHEPEDLADGLCSQCGAPCQEVLRNFGIGPYEFWGQQGVQEDWARVSPCCEAEVIPKPLTEDEDEEG
jgi:hypothetical protein